MILAMLFFSVPHAIGEMILIFAVVLDVLLSPTMTVFSPMIVSSIMSDTLIVKVHDFLIANPLENNLAPWSSGRNV
jgi:hypothetical protein